MSEAPSGLGYVRVKAMNIEDTLPSHDYHHRGNRMQGAQDHLIKVYIYNPVTGDVLCLHVPYNMRVGPVKQPPTIGGLQLDALVADVCNLKSLISEKYGCLVNQLRLMFKQESLLCDEASLNEYNICHGSTITLLTRTVRKSAGTLMLACEANRIRLLRETAKLRSHLLSSHPKNGEVDVQFSPRWEHVDSPGLFEEGGMLHRDSSAFKRDDIYLEPCDAEPRDIPAMRYHGNTLNE